MSNQTTIDTLTNILINDILFELVLEAKTMKTKLGIQQQQSMHSTQNTSTDTPTQLNNCGISRGQGDPLNPNFECLICNRWISSNRYAPHLNNCLGLRGSRNSTRSAANTNTYDTTTKPPPTKHTMTNTLKHTNKPRQSSPLSHTQTHDHIFTEISKELFSPSNSSSSALSSPPKRGSASLKHDADIAQSPNSDESS